MGAAQFYRLYSMIELVGVLEQNNEKCHFLFDNFSFDILMCVEDRG